MNWWSGQETLILERINCDTKNPNTQFTWGLDKVASVTKLIDLIAIEESGILKLYIYSRIIIT